MAEVPPVPRLLAITPDPGASPDAAHCAALVEQVETLADAGVDWFLFRAPWLRNEAAVPLLQTLIQRSGNARWLVHGSGPVDLTHPRILGVHYPARALPTGRLGASLLGASIHDAVELADATRCGANYVLFSPVFAPSTKPVPGVGLAALRTITEQACMPVLALGGVAPARVAGCLEHGAAGVAVMSGLFQGPNLRANAEAYLEALRAT